MELNKYKNRTMQSIRNELAYDRLPAWRKFLHSWGMCKWSIKYPFIYYKLWKLANTQEK